MFILQPKFKSEDKTENNNLLYFFLKLQHKTILFSYSNLLELYLQWQFSKHLGLCYDTKDISSDNIFPYLENCFHLHLIIIAFVNKQLFIIQQKQKLTIHKQEYTLL